MIVLIAGLGVGIGYLAASNISFLKVPEKGVSVKQSGKNWRNNCRQRKLHMTLHYRTKEKYLMRLNPRI